MPLFDFQALPPPPKRRVTNEYLPRHDDVISHSSLLKKETNRVKEERELGRGIDLFTSSTQSLGRKTNSFSKSPCFLTEVHRPIRF